MLGMEQLIPAWPRGALCFQPEAPPAEPALSRKKVFPVHLLTQSSGDVARWDSGQQPFKGQHRSGCVAMGDVKIPPLSACQGLAVPWGGSWGLRQGVALDASFGVGGHWLKQLWGQWRMAQGERGEMSRQVPAPVWLCPAPGFPFLVIGWQPGPKIARAAAFPAPPPRRTPDVWIGAPPPTFPQEETQGWREEEAAPQEGRDRRDRGTPAWGWGAARTEPLVPCWNGEHPAHPLPPAVAVGAELCPGARP